jgi:hypothetical protein
LNNLHIRQLDQDGSYLLAKKVFGFLFYVSGFSSWDKNEVKFTFFVQKARKFKTIEDAEWFVRNLIEERLYEVKGQGRVKSSY